MEEQVREALGEVDVDRGVHDYPDVAGTDHCGWSCGGDSVREGAEFAVEGGLKDGGPSVVFHVEAVRMPGYAHGGTNDHAGCWMH